MAEVYDFRESARKLGREPEAPPKVEEVARQPPAVFVYVDSNEIGAFHELKSVEVREPDVPELEM